MNFNEMAEKWVGFIKTRGIGIVGVFDAKPSFAYSVGAGRSGLPDILITGNLNPEIAAHFINSAFDEMKSDGLRLGLNTSLATVPCYILACTERQEILYNDYVIQADNIYGEKETSTTVVRNIPEDSAIPHFVQIVFPDKHGNFPWSNEYSRSTFKQPVFCKAPN